jgi:beta-ureidopropionase / N-carbamoyl-L-amino-acid hydrolase
MTPTPPPARSDDPMEWLNHASDSQAMAWLHGIYEHSPWVAQAALQHKPFRSLAHLKWALADSVSRASHEQQLMLVKAHPVLAAKPAKGLTAESQQEQQLAGLWQSTAAQADELRQLNETYLKHFGWPFIIAVRGPRGLGLSPDAILAQLRRRMSHPPAVEFHECLRQIHRIAETRLNEKCQSRPLLGGEVWDWHEWLAQFSDEGFAERGELSVSYLTPAHVHVRTDLEVWACKHVVLMRWTSTPSAMWSGVTTLLSNRWQIPADRQPLRHGAQRRQVRRTIRFFCAHGLCAGTCPCKAALVSRH